MNLGGERVKKPTQRLLWPFLGLLMLSMVLQGTSLVAVLEIDKRLALSRRQISAAASQRAIVEQFERATYLALVGLATSDWELLLRQRASIQELDDRFRRLNQAMLQGGSVRLVDAEVTLAGIQEPEVRELLTPVAALWDQAHQAHTRLLRSENHSLKQNADLAQLRTTTQRLSETLSKASVLIQAHTQKETVPLSRIQRIIPAAAFLLILLLFAFVLWRILLPFATSTEELARSEAELRRARDELELRVAERTEQLARANEALRHSHDDLELRVRERTQELKDAQRHAVELARQAGMAELATNVLHNVGNVLNSINTSSTILGERLQASRVESLLKLSRLLEERRADLAAFITADERGRRLPEYLDTLGRHLAAEREEMRGLTVELQRHVEHIRMIVETQQSYAMSSSLLEETSLEELIEDALRISMGALTRHGITIERHITPLPRVMLDKHKLLQILLNLISNAKYAVSENPAGQRRLTLRVDPPTGNRVRMQVIDNGIGIAPELFLKIFQHGFTTRKDGHGFGLHSCAITARALGGSLVVHSDGPGKGAAFTLELPFSPPGSVV